jgi:hypothetical protein
MFVNLGYNMDPGGGATCQCARALAPPDGEHAGHAAEGQVGGVAERGVPSRGRSSHSDSTSIGTTGARSLTAMTV